MEFKKIIRKLGEIDRTPAWLCRQAGVHRSIFTRIKNGDRNLTESMMKRFYKILKINEPKRKRSYNDST